MEKKEKECKKEKGAKKEKIMLEEKLVTEESMEIITDRGIDEGANGISTEFKI